MMTKQQLDEAYKRTPKRQFSKFAEMFWILFNDGVNGYLTSIETLCTYYPECNRQELEEELDKYI